MTEIPKDTRSLLRQAMLRLALSLAVAVLAAAALTAWLYQTAEDKAIAHEMSTTRIFYQNKLAEWEETWEMTALRYKTLLEISGRLEDRENRWAKLYGYLTAQGEGQTFSTILIASDDGRVVFRFGPEAKYLPDTLTHTGHAAWFYQPEPASLYRAYFQPIWLGELGMGKLVLLRKMDNALLFQNAQAHAILSLMWDGKEVASSTGTVPKNARVDEISLPWHGGETHAPVLAIRIVNHPLISSAAIAAASLLVLTSFFLLLWWILGRWMLQLTRRIVALGLASREFAERHKVSPQLKSHLESARDLHEDEISLVARSLENLTETAVQREAALRESESRIREITNSVADGVIELDQHGIIVFANPQAERFLGWNAEELLGKDAHGTFHYLAPDRSALPVERCLVHQALQTGVAFQTDLNYFVHRDKYLFPVSLAATPVIREGVVKGAVITFRDISQQRQAEIALQESEERFRIIADHTSTWENRVDPEGRLQWVNLMAQQMTGYAPDELYAMAHFPLPIIYPDDRAATSKHFAASVTGQAQAPLECRVLRKDGSHFYASVSTQAIYAADGRFLGHLGSVHDVSVQKALQQQLHGALQQLQTILDNAQVGIAYLEQRRVIWINRRMEEIFGFTLEEIRDQSIEVIYPSREDYEQLGREAYPLLSQGRPFETEHRMKRRNGQTFWAHLRGMAIEPRDTAQGSIWIVLDIDSRKASEQALITLNANLAQQVASETAKNLEKERLLVQQARHAAMGEMIGNIAHQWRQPLSVLGLILQNISIDFEDNQLDAAELKHYVADAMNSIQQMSATIDDFRDFFRPNRIKECYQIGQAVAESLKLVSASLKNNDIEVQLKGPDKLEICGYPNEFAQVLMNLISNAKDALAERKPGRPRIEIETRGNMENRTLAITVRDNAGGIPEEVAEKIFDPYFTTKDKGTGIGLYITKTIVEQHMGGTISFLNQGEGAEFTITLPLAEFQEETQEAP